MFRDISRLVGLSCVFEGLRGETFSSPSLSGLWWCQLSRGNRVFSAHLSRRIMFCRRQLIASNSGVNAFLAVAECEGHAALRRLRRFIAEFIVSALSLRFSGLANVDDVNAVGCNSRKGRWRRRRRRRRRRRLIYLQAVRPAAAQDSQNGKHNAAAAAFPTNAHVNEPMLCSS